jgi:hypothetical protein
MFCVNVPASNVLRHGECVDELIGVYRLMVGKSEGERPLGTRRKIWKDNLDV